MSHEKTVEKSWGSVDSALENSGSDPLLEMTEREVAEEVEHIREETPEKDLRVKALEDRNMVEFSDIAEEQLDPESYSDQKEYALGLVDPEVRGAERKFQDESEEVSEIREFHNRRAEIYGKGRKISKKVRGPAAVGGIPGTFGGVMLAASGEPLLASVAAVPMATFFGSFPAELGFEKKEDEHRHHGEYVRTEKFEDEAYPLFDAADVVVASREGDRNLFQDEALQSYEILDEDAELVHAAEIEDYNPGDDPYAVDLRVDVHPLTGEGSTEEPAEEVQYVLVGGENLKEAYKDLTWD